MEGADGSIGDKAKHATDFTHAGHVVVAADAVREEPIPDLPGKDGGALPLILGDALHHVGGGHPRLGAADGAGLDRTGLVVPGQESYIYVPYVLNSDKNTNV